MSEDSGFLVFINKMKVLHEIKSYTFLIERALTCCLKIQLPSFRGGEIKNKINHRM